MTRAFAEPIGHFSRLISRERIETMITSRQSAPQLSAHLPEQDGGGRAGSKSTHEDTCLRSFGQVVPIEAVNQDVRINAVHAIDRASSGRRPSQSVAPHRAFPTP